ncbi:MAG: HipA domain-containing protein [Bacteroidota bacterium]
MANDNKNILVYANWQELAGAVLIGTLNVSRLRGKEIFAFEYNEEWLNRQGVQNLDPDLQLFAGKQYLNNDKTNFGLFMDSAPDRWGRVLMKRREAILARREERKPEMLMESDFLLGVYDQNRMGALRFKLVEDDQYLGHEKELAAPPWTLLRDLEYASLQLEDDSLANNDEELKWLNMLMAPGSSLGGARPKASVTDPDGNLWIAKFPSVNDEIDMGGWEMVVHELARMSGVNVPQAMVKKFAGKHHTFLTKRFDRVNQTDRIHFASAMTLLGAVDGVDFQSGASYLDLVGLIQKKSSRVNENLKELWTRIAFNVLVKNTDDHLRNHGFLLSSDGWDLSPAYDMNAVSTGTGLTLNISEDDNSLDVNLVLEVSAFFRIKLSEAKDIIADIRKSVSFWKQIASKYKLSSREQEIMARAFN